MQHYSNNLRFQDLIAKTAGIHLSSTVRVLKALKLIAAAVDMDEAQIFEAYPDLFDLDPPSDDNVLAVFEGTEMIKGYLIGSGLGIDYLERIKTSRTTTDKNQIGYANRRWNKKTKKNVR